MTRLEHVLASLEGIPVGTTTGMTGERIIRIVRDADYALRALEEGRVEPRRNAIRASCKLRRMATIERATRYLGVGTADCGHTIVRMNHLAVGQRVFCFTCGINAKAATA